MISQGYSIPYAVNRRRRILLVILLFFLITALGVYEYQEYCRKGWSGQDIHRMMTLYCLLFGGAFLAELAQCLAMVHFVPEGIAVTIFGLTVLRFPTPQIKLLGGIYIRSSKVRPRCNHIAVCDRTLEEMAEIGEQRTPKMLRNSRTFPNWAEDTAGKFLYRRGGSFLRSVNRGCRILWLEWDAERLEVLLQLYPAARWIDFTDKKIFDEQLRQR